MKDYYKILEIEAESSALEIKVAFRKKAKKIHPDIHRSSGQAEHNMMDLLEAYEVLSHPVQRDEYDKKHKIIFGRSDFNYREFLQNLSEDPAVQSRLIFYDLLHRHEKEALQSFENLCLNTGYQLQDYLDREDFMDCVFLLAEEFEKEGKYLQAFDLLKTIVEMEASKPYFRHFIEEVIDRLRIITCQKMSRQIDPEQHLHCLEEMVDCNFSPKHTAFYYKNIAELYYSLEDSSNAITYLKKALDLDNHLSGTKQLKKKLNLVDC